jgi:hypothetical protein
MGGLAMHTPGLEVGGPGFYGMKELKLVTLGFHSKG